MTKLVEQNELFETIIVEIAKTLDAFLLRISGLSGEKVRESCRSGQELSNEYLLAKISLDTAENEPLKALR